MTKEQYDVWTSQNTGLHTPLQQEIGMFPGGSDFAQYQDPYGTASDVLHNDPWIPHSNSPQMESYADSYEVFPNSASGAMSDVASNHDVFIDPALSAPTSAHTRDSTMDQFLPPSFEPSQQFPIVPRLSTPVPPKSQSSRSPSSRQTHPAPNPEVVVHQPQDYKQRQKQELAHTFAVEAASAGSGIPRSQEELENMFLKVMSGAYPTNDYEDPTSPTASESPSRANQNSSGSGWLSPNGHENKFSWKVTRKSPSVIASNQSPAHSESSFRKEQGLKCKRCAKILPRNCDMRYETLYAFQTAYTCF